MAETTQPPQSTTAAPGKSNHRGQSAQALLIILGCTIVLAAGAYAVVAVLPTFFEHQKQDRLDEAYYSIQLKDAATLASKTWYPSNSVIQTITDTLEVKTPTLAGYWDYHYRFASVPISTLYDADTTKLGAAGYQVPTTMNSTNAAADGFTANDPANQTTVRISYNSSAGAVPTPLVQDEEIKIFNTP